MTLRFRTTPPGALTHDLPSLQREEAVEASGSPGTRLERVMEHIDHICGNKGYPPVIKQTADEYANRLKTKIMVDDETLATAFVYLSTRACGMTILPGSILTFVGNISDGVYNPGEARMSGLFSACKKVTRLLGLKIPPYDAEVLAASFCDELKMGAEVRKTAVEVIKSAKDAGADLVQISPENGIGDFRKATKLAGAAVYVSGFKHGCCRTQREIAEVAGVTEVTMRAAYIALAKDVKMAHSILTQCVQKPKPGSTQAGNWPSLFVRVPQPEV